MPKLPKNLPPLPPVPEGFDRWEYKGKWTTNDKPVGAPWGCSYTNGGDWWEHSGAQAEALKLGQPNEGICEGCSLHIIVAVRDPKPAPKCRKGMQAGDKFRACEKPAGHRGKCAASLGGVMTADISPAPKKRKGRVVAKLHTVMDRGCTIRYNDSKPLPPYSRAFVLPADAASVERMVEQVAECLAGTSGTNMSDDQVAEVVLGAIGITATSNVIDLLKKAHTGRRYFCNPDYPFIPMVKADPAYWARRGWKLSETGRAVRRIKR